MFIVLFEYVDESNIYVIEFEVKDNSLVKAPNLLLLIIHILVVKLALYYNSDIDKLLFILFFKND